MPGALSNHPWTTAGSCEGVELGGKPVSFEAGILDLSVVELFGVEARA